MRKIVVEMQAELLKIIEATDVQIVNRAIDLRPTGEVFGPAQRLISWNTPPVPFGCSYCYKSPPVFGKLREDKGSSIEDDTGRTMTRTSPK